MNCHLFPMLLFLKRAMNKNKGKKNLVCQLCTSKKQKTGTTVGTSNNKYLIPEGKMETYKFRE